MTEPLLAARGIRKSFGAVEALAGVSLTVRAGEVTCLLGDNGAGKSTLIKILSGVLQPDSGDIRVDGTAGAVRLGPRCTRPRHRNGVPGPRRGPGDADLPQLLPRPRTGARLGAVPHLRQARRHAPRAEEIARFGIAVDDVTRPIVTLSGGERQSVAIARAIHFGARVLILDEPTSALGVKESEIVLRFIRRAKERGIGIVFITHNVHHAWLIGDSFEILKRGSVSQAFEKSALTKDQLLTEMAGGEDLERLQVVFASD